MPSILQSLGECLTSSPSDVNVDRVVALISYDKSLVAQCLRMANSALFGRRVPIDSVRGAVLALGMWRIRDIVYSCTLPMVFSGRDQGMSPTIFWRHALGTALVSQHLAQRLAIPHIEKLYLGGLLHDIGILVNSLLFEKDFQRVMQEARSTESPLLEVESKVLGFSHCDSDRFWPRHGSCLPMRPQRLNHTTDRRSGRVARLSLWFIWRTCCAACAVWDTDTTKPENSILIPKTHGNCCGKSIRLRLSLTSPDSHLSWTPMRWKSKGWWSQSSRLAV